MKKIGRFPLEKIYLGLGGDEGKILPRLKEALQLLKEQEGFFDFEHSHFYRTSPVEMQGECWFVNAVCSFQTHLPADDVFAITQWIEERLGKVPKPKNASRPIDIDVLFYGSSFIKDAHLEIPHPRWKERLFVLQPLSDLISEIVLDENGRETRYHLENLINDLTKNSSQELYLLEKNPHFQ